MKTTPTIAVHPRAVFGAVVGDERGLFAIGWPDTATKIDLKMVSFSQKLLRTENTPTPATATDRRDEERRGAAGVCSHTRVQVLQICRVPWCCRDPRGQRKQGRSTATSVRERVGETTPVGAFRTPSCFHLSSTRIAAASQLKVFLQSRHVYRRVYIQQMKDTKRNFRVYGRFGLWFVLR